MAERDILVVGGGSREHAMTWGLKKSTGVGKVFVGPGNAGTEGMKDTMNINVNIKSPKEILEAAKDLNVDLVVIGPEEPLASGVVDLLQENFIPAFGPTKNAARLESSKSFAMRFMTKYGVSHPKTIIATSLTGAQRAITNPQWETEGFVLKENGLKQGKGVRVVDKKEEALAIAQELYADERFDQENPLVIQEKLIGFEVSVMAIVDGLNYTVMPYAKDHKQLLDGDLGPLTGGMGAVCPHPMMTEELDCKIQEQIIKPILEGLRKEGIHPRGILYPGLMLTENGIYVLEINFRPGCPEFDAMVPLLGNQLFPIILRASTGELRGAAIDIDPRHSVALILASEGYPNTPKTNEVIFGLNEVKSNQDVLVFHGATKKNDKDEVLNTGGRVLDIVAKAETLEKAVNKAYGAVGPNGVYFKGMQLRRDIGKKRNE